MVCRQVQRQQSGASPESIGTKPVRVGANSRVTPATNFFTGEVDEVRIWNTALSASQVTCCIWRDFRSRTYFASSI